MNALPWYRSPVLIGLIVAFVFQIFALFHVSVRFTEAQLGSTLDTLAQIIALVAAGLSGWLRVRSKVQPLTLTQKGADSHPANTLPQPAAAATSSPAIKDIDKVVGIFILAIGISIFVSFAIGAPS